MKFTEETIYKYLDGDLSEREIKLFNDEVNSNKSFNSLFEKINSIDTALKDSQLSSPSPDFAKKVMGSVTIIDEREAKFFNGARVLSLSLILLIVATSMYYFATNFYPSLAGTVADQITLKNFTINLQPAQQLLDSTVLFKIVLYVNGLISLLLLDRAILKPYFKRRKQGYAM